MTAGPALAFIALGANLDQPVQQVSGALRELDSIERTHVIVVSSLYRTKPVGYADQPDFINAVAQVETALSPRALLDQLHVIEERHGRQRSFRNAPRTLDLDLLTYGDLVLDEDGLTLPHPRLHQRAFVLMPLAEIAPHAPIRGREDALEMLARLDRAGIEKISTATADGT
jgi:2-amino-4-hydroxy-6-hydroxymethyldihydropteridine diphosphokinase